MNQETLKLSFVTNIPTPYRLKQFDLLEGFFPKLKVFLLRDDMEDREWKFETRRYMYRLPKVFGFGQNMLLNSGLINLVARSDIVIIGGYNYVSYIALSLLCSIYGRPYILLIDGLPPSRLKRSGNKYAQFIKRIFATRAAAILANGDVSRAYCEQVLGVPPSRIFNQYLSIDHTLFSRNLSVKEVIRSQVRLEMGFADEHKVILFSGRFIRRKRIIDIVDAIARLDEGEDVSLLLVGSGEMRGEIIGHAAQAGVKIIDVGFSSQEDLYRYYFASDLLVLPSENEPWGLVCNEANSCAVPIVVSDDSGASVDLVKNGINGFSFQTGNIEDLKDKIELALKLDVDLVSDYSNTLARKWTIEESVKSIVSAVSSIREKQP